MAGSTTAMCTSFKSELMQAKHNFTVSTGNAFKMALIKVSPTGTYNANTLAAGTPGTGSPTISNLGTDEVTGTGYTTGGFALTNVTPLTDTAIGAAYTNFSVNPNWTSATFSATAAIIYNSSLAGNNAVSIHDFGGTQPVSAGTFTVVMPTANSTFAILRIN